MGYPPRGINRQTPVKTIPAVLLRTRVVINTWIYPEVFLNVQNFCRHQSSIAASNEASHDLWALIHFDVWTCNGGILSLIEIVVNKTIGFQ